MQAHLLVPTTSVKYVYHNINGIILLDIHKMSFLKPHEVKSWGYRTLCPRMQEAWRTNTDSSEVVLVLAAFKSGALHQHEAIAYLFFSFH